MQNKEILVTGGSGFLGKHVVSKLIEHGAHENSVRVPRRPNVDLRNPEDCRIVSKGMDLIIHLAARVGGIGYNKENPATLFYDNIEMGVHMMDEAQKAGVDKFVAVGTVCAYPKFVSTPFKEEDLWNGYPEDTNAPYGLAKKMLLVQAQAYRQQYNFNAIYLLPVNLYGPGDNFDPKSSHVIPALIRKFHEARVRNLPDVEVWGTGRATREFLYVEDAAEGIVMAAERYDKPDPVNLGSSFEISIRELAEMVGKLTKYKGNINFDQTKPDGQPRRKLDVSRAEKEFGFKSKTTFEDGLAKTIEWYEKKIRSKA